MQRLRDARRELRQGLPLLSLATSQPSSSTSASIIPQPFSSPRALSSPWLSSSWPSMAEPQESSPWLLLSPWLLSSCARAWDAGQPDRIRTSAAHNEMKTTAADIEGRRALIDTSPYQAPRPAVVLCGGGHTSAEVRGQSGRDVTSVRPPSYSPTSLNARRRGSASCNPSIRTDGRGEAARHALKLPRPHLPD